MISIHIYVLFGLMMILGIFEYWFARTMLIKEFEKGQNELLEEIRGLCNELLNIKNKGTIKIISLSLSKEKGPSRVKITTIPKGDFKNESKN